MKFFEIRSVVIFNRSGSLRLNIIEIPFPLPAGAPIINLYPFNAPRNITKGIPEGINFVKSIENLEIKFLKFTYLNTIFFNDL